MLGGYTRSDVHLSTKRGVMESPKSSFICNKVKNAGISCVKHNEATHGVHSVHTK
jgi:hypothetical protein